jgi:hypothetical protein
VIPEGLSTSSADCGAGKARQGRLPATPLAAIQGVQPVVSLDEMAVDVFGSDEELEEFLAFTYAERRRDLDGPDAFHWAPAAVILP